MNNDNTLNNDNTMNKKLPTNPPLSYGMNNNNNNNNNNESPTGCPFDQFKFAADQIFVYETASVIACRRKPPVKVWFHPLFYKFGSTFSLIQVWSFRPLFYKLGSTISVLVWFHPR